MAINYKEVLKGRGYRKLFATTIINRFGDSIDAIAFTWLVYQVTHSGAWSAIIFALNILPNVIVQPFAGAAVERLDKKKVMVVTHILRGLVLIAFMAMYLSGLVNGWIMAGFTFIITSIEAFNMPAGTAFIPRIIKKEHITHALSLNTSVSSMVTLVGTGIAGVIIAKVGVYTAMIIDVITFFVSALIIFSIRQSEMVEQENVGAEANIISDAEQNIEQNSEQNNAQNIEYNTAQNTERIKKPSYFSTLKEGISYIRSRRVILNYCLIAVVVNAMLAPINALQAPLVSECYHMGSGMLSLIGMAYSIGSIIGSILVPIIDRKLSMRNVVFIFGCMIGITVMLLTMGGGLGELVVVKCTFAVLCSILMAGASAILSGLVSVKMIANVEEKYLARVSAVFGSLVTAAMPVASLIISWAKLRVETGTLIMAGGIATLVCFIMIRIINPELEMNKETANEDKTAGEYKEIQKGQMSYAGENG
ncbi:MAG: MFS transporter [Eubacterium sp.]|nr:MFS transporter [Eubacterium sp.]